MHKGYMVSDFPTITLSGSTKSNFSLWQVTKPPQKSMLLETGPAFDLPPMIAFNKESNFSGIIFMRISVFKYTSKKQKHTKATSGGKCSFYASANLKKLWTCAQQ